MDLFSHAPAPEITPQQGQANPRTHAVYTELNQPFEEIWEGFVGYMHLWLPQQLRSEPNSYVEVTTEHLLDQTEEGENSILAETAHYAPGDVIALRPVEGTELHRVFPQGVSFTFDIGEEQAPSLVEVSSGLVLPRELVEDAELGVSGSGQVELARQLLEAFTRFMGSEQPVRVERL